MAEDSRARFLKKVFLLGQRYSYQITFDTQSEDEDEWRLIAYYRENGELLSATINFLDDTSVPEQLRALLEQLKKK